jgi:hypothetical protein
MKKGNKRPQPTPQARTGVKLSRDMLLPSFEALGLRAHYKPRRHCS